MRAVTLVWLVAILGTLALLAAGCGGGRVHNWQIDGLGASLTEIQRNARREARLDLVLRPGYEEGGRAEKFTQQTGCEVTTRNATSADDLVDLTSSGDYDGVLTTSDVTRRLIAGGDVAPVNFDLVPGRRDVFDDLKGRAFDTVEGMGYGIPQGRSANVEVVRTDFLPPGSQSLELIWGPVLRGRISIYDDPMVIADAALYLKLTKPKLRITSPYELDAAQFAAVRRLLRRERRSVSNRWNAATAAGQIAAFASERAIVGITWPHQVTLMQAEDPPLPVAAEKPVEGTTGWVDEWLIAAQADHPNCMYLWLDYIVSPEANAKVVELFSEAPANARACDFTPSPSACADLHADDEEWWNDVSYWRTPETQCGDARGAVCKSYEDWRDAWLALKG